MYTLIYIYDLVLLAIMGYSCLFIHNVQREILFEDEENDELAHSEDNSEDFKLLEQAEKLLKRSNYVKALLNVQKQPNSFIKMRQK